MRIHPAAHKKRRELIIDGCVMLQQMFLRLHGYLWSERVQGRNRQKHQKNAFVHQRQGDEGMEAEGWGGGEQAGFR